jgi:hypothetical protein
VREG